MYICVCNAVTERQIHQAVQDGASTVKHLKETLGVGKDCGSCVRCARACIKEAEASAERNSQSSGKLTLVQVA